MVIVGVLGESAELLVKWGRKRRFRKRLNDVNRRRLVGFVKVARPKLLPVETVFFTVLVIGLAIEFLGSHTATRIADRENVRLKLKAEQAGKDAALANINLQFLWNDNLELQETVEGLRSNNLGLQKQVEELRSNNIALEAQSSPRMMEQHRLVAAIQQFSGVKVIIISAIGGDCTDTASQIANALNSAKWNAEPIIPTFKPVPSGISVGICSTNENWIAFLDWEPDSMPGKQFSGIEAGEMLKLTNSCAVLVDALNNNDVDAKIDRDINRATSLRFNGVIIFVGPKPSLIDHKILREQINLDNIEKKRDQPGYFWDAKLQHELAKERKASLIRRQDLEQKRMKSWNGTNLGGYFISGGGSLP